MVKFKDRGEVPIHRGHHVEHRDDGGLLDSLLHWNESGQGHMSPALAGRIENAKIIQQKIFAAARRAHEDRRSALGSLYQTMYEECVAPFLAAASLAEIEGVVFGADGCAVKYIELVHALLRYAKRSDEMAVSRREPTERRIGSAAEVVLGEGFGHAITKAIQMLTLGDALAPKIHDLPATDQKTLLTAGFVALAWTWAAVALVAAGEQAKKLSEDQYKLLCQHLFGMPKERYVAIRKLDKRLRPQQDMPDLEMAEAERLTDPLLDSH